MDMLIAFVATRVDRRAQISPIRSADMINIWQHEPVSIVIRQYFLERLPADQFNLLALSDTGIVGMPTNVFEDTNVRAVAISSRTDSDAKTSGFQ